MASFPCFCETASLSHAIPLNFDSIVFFDDDEGFCGECCSGLHETCSRINVQLFFYYIVVYTSYCWVSKIVFMFVVGLWIGFNFRVFSLFVKTVAIRVIKITKKKYCDTLLRKALVLFIQQQVIPYYLRLKLVHRCRLHAHWYANVSLRI